MLSYGNRKLVIEKAWHVFKDRFSIARKTSGGATLGRLNETSDRNNLESDFQVISIASRMIQLVLLAVNNDKLA